MSELLSEIYDLSTSPLASPVSEPAVRDVTPIAPALDPADAHDFLDPREFSPRWWPLPVDEE